MAPAGEKLRHDGTCSRSFQIQLNLARTARKETGRYLNPNVNFIWAEAREALVLKFLTGEKNVFPCACTCVHVYMEDRG